MKTNFFLLLCTPGTLLTGQVLFTSILLCTGFYIIVLWTVDYFIENDDDNESPTY